MAPQPNGRVPILETPALRAAMCIVVRRRNISWTILINTRKLLFQYINPFVQCNASQYYSMRISINRDSHHAKTRDSRRHAQSPKNLLASRNVTPITTPPPTTTLQSFLSFDLLRKTAIPDKRAAGPNIVMATMPTFDLYCGGRNAA